VTRTLDAGAPDRKLLGAWQAKALVAAVGVLVLVFGVLTRPRAVTPVPLPQPSPERSAPLIEAELAGRRLPSPFRASHDVGTRAAGFGVTVAPPPRTVRRTRAELPEREALSPPGSGVLIAPGALVLTHAAALDGRTRVAIVAAGSEPATPDPQHTSSALNATAIAFEPQSGIVLLRLDAPLARPVAPLADTAPVAGDVLTAAADFGIRPYILAVPVISVDASRAIVRLGQAVPPGMPLYDESARLVAVASLDGIAVLANEAIGRLTTIAALSGGGIRSATGVVLQSIDPSLVPWFGTGGAIVADLIAGSPADLAGLSPGDVIARIGDTPVTDVDDALTRLTSVPADEPIALEVRRGTGAKTARARSMRTSKVELTPVSALELYAAGRGRPAGTSAPRAVPGGRSATSPTMPAPHVSELATVTDIHVPGTAPDAVVLAVNGQPVVSVDAAAREVRRTRNAALLYVEDGGERFFTTTQDAAP
jgi:S1-C subfamily serine protease